MKRITVAIVVCITIALSMPQVLNAAEQKGFAGNVRAELQISRHALSMSEKTRYSFSITVTDPVNPKVVQNGTAGLIRGKDLQISNTINGTLSGSIDANLAVPDKTGTGKAGVFFDNIKNGFQSITSNYEDVPYIPYGPDGVYDFVAYILTQDGKKIWSNIVPVFVSTTLPPYLWTTAPTDDDSINLATGEEELAFAPDIVADNPLNTPVSFTRTYCSGRAKIRYGSPGLSPGWTHNFDTVIKSDSKPQADSSLILCHPNGNEEEMIPLDTGTANVALKIPKYGPPFAVKGNRTTSNVWSDITLTWQDGTAWIFRPLTTGSTTYVIKNITTPLKNNLKLNWNSRGGISSIQNDSTSLTNIILKFTYNADGLLSRISDEATFKPADVEEFARNVDYTYDTTKLLTSVSYLHKLKEVGTAQWKYQYRPYGVDTSRKTLYKSSHLGSGAEREVFLINDGADKGKIKYTIFAKKQVREYFYLQKPWGKIGTKQDGIVRVAIVSPVFDANGAVKLGTDGYPSGEILKDVQMSYN